MQPDSASTTGVADLPKTVTHVITDLHTGGAESMLVRLLSASVYRQTSCVFSMRSRGSRGALIEALGVPVETFGMAVHASVLQSAYKLQRAVRRRRARVVQGWMYHANVAATLTTWHDDGAVHVWNIRETIQDIGREKPLTQAMIRLGAALSERPAAIIYNSRASAAQHARLGYAHSRAIVIPNGIDIARFAASDAARRTIRASLGIPSDALLVGRIGRFHPMKDFPGMLRTAAIVAQAMPDVHFVLGGPGITMDNNELVRRMHEFGLTACVHLVGDVEDVSTFMAGLDVNCSSSAWGEAFPNVIVEAMASQVPCVTTDVGDSAWVVGDGGLVVPPGDPLAFAASLLRLLRLDAPARRAIGDLGRRRVAREFDLRDIAARYDALYTGLIRDEHG